MGWDARLPLAAAHWAPHSSCLGVMLSFPLSEEQLSWLVSL